MKGFFQKVYQLVKLVPEGKVVTYGQIAKILNTPDARRVGHALHANKNSLIPCHRVVNKEGGLAKNFGWGGWQEQARRLEKEGVKVRNQQIDLGKYQYYYKLT